MLLHRGNPLNYYIKDSSDIIKISPEHRKWKIKTVFMKQIYKPDKGSRWKKKITDQYHIWILMQKLNEIGYRMQHYIKKLYTINK